MTLKELLAKNALIEKQREEKRLKAEAEQKAKANINDEQKEIDIEESEKEVVVEQVAGKQTNRGRKPKNREYMVVEDKEEA